MNSSNSWRVSNMSSCPKLRIEGFTDAWEQRKLGDVTEEFRSGSFIPASRINTKGEYPVYGGNGLRGYTNTYNHDGEFALIGRQGALCGNMNYSVGKAYFTEHAVAVKANSLSDTKFLYYLLSVMRLGQYSDQSAQPGLAVGKLINLQNMFPRSNEQHRIGEFFYNLDNLITLHQRRSDALKNAKKYFLKNMFPSEGEKFPKLRLEGFTDAWEQRKFVETFDFLPNNSLSRAQLTYENGTVKNVHYGDVLIKFGELLDVGNEELPYLIDDSLIKNYSSAVLKNGDVVIADAAEDETVGKCSEIKGIKDEKILSGLHTIPVRPRVEFENGYLGYFMNSHSYHDQLLPLIQGTKVSSISKKVLENTVISYPASSSEQEKIAKFFESLTNLITLHQRKY